MDPRYVGACAELACLLEVSASKPGNVNRYRDFSDTRYEHFLASAVALRGVCEDAASFGNDVGRGDIDIEDLGLGRLIKKAVLETKLWQRGRNTNLGMILLLVPLSASAGMAASKQDGDLREGLDDIIRNSTSQDTVALYEAIEEASPGGMGEADVMDVKDRNSKKLLIKDNINLYKIMKMTKNDSIAEEYIKKYRITFGIGYKYLNEQYLTSKDINDSILFCYLNILAKIPDTLIARKAGADRAEDVSARAREILEMGMPDREMDAFDRFLRQEGNRLNPGTTADLTAASVMVALLEGVRP